MLSLRSCSAGEFLQHIAGFTPDLIFLDHQMDLISGPTAIQALRSNPAYAHIPVIYFSSEQNIITLAREAGADAHLKKPFTIQRLIDTTKQFIP